MVTNEIGEIKMSEMDKLIVTYGISGISLLLEAAYPDKPEIIKISEMLKNALTEYKKENQEMVKKW